MQIDKGLSLWLASVTFAFVSIVSKGSFNPVGSIGCGDLVFGSIERYEINNYTFELTGDYPVVQITTCGSNYDTWLYVWNSRGTEIEDCDDCGDCGTRTVLAIDDLDTGSYYIGVGGYYSSSGIYRLEVTCGDGTVAPIDYSTTYGDGGDYADWNCNHFYEYPLPLPCISSSWFSVSAKCVDYDKVELSYYDERGCNGDVNDTIIVNSTSLDDGSALMCSYIRSCDYYSYAVYWGECSDDNLTLSGYQVVGECSSYTYYGFIDYRYWYKESCKDNGDLTTTVYSCDSCSSNCRELSYDEGNAFDSINSTNFCVEVKYFL